MRDDRRYEIAVAVFAAALYVACLVAAFGLLSLYLDVDVIPEPDAGPLLGPVMCAIATVALFGILAWGRHRRPTSRQHISVGSAVLTGFAIYVLFVICGGIMYSLGSSTHVPFLSFTLRMGTSWFGLASGVLAIAVSLAYQAVLRARFRDRGRPEWPWEHNGD